MQIANIRPIAVSPKSDQPNGYEVDIQVEWLDTTQSWLVGSAFFSVVSVPLLDSCGATTDQIATEGLRLFRAALESTEPSDVRTTLELSAGLNAALEEAD
jgi:hypothetical protein